MVGGVEWGGVGWFYALLVGFVVLEGGCGFGEGVVLAGGMAVRRRRGTWEGIEIGWVLGYRGYVCWEG